MNATANTLTIALPLCRCHYHEPEHDHHHDHHNWHNYERPHYGTSHRTATQHITSRRRGVLWVGVHSVVALNKWSMLRLRWRDIASGGAQLRNQCGAARSTMSGGPDAWSRRQGMALSSVLGAPSFRRAVSQTFVRSLAWVPGLVPCVWGGMVLGPSSPAGVCSLSTWRQFCVRLVDCPRS